MGTLFLRQECIEKQAMAQAIEAEEKSAVKDENGQRFCLERKEIFESETRKIQGARRTLEQLILTLESAAANKDVVTALQTVWRQYRLHGSGCHTDVESR
jgi:hypothetical protein